MISMIILLKQAKQQHCAQERFSKLTRKNKPKTSQLVVILLTTTSISGKIKTVFPYYNTEQDYVIERKTFQLTGFFYNHI